MEKCEKGVWEWKNIYYHILYEKYMSKRIDSAFPVATYKQMLLYKTDHDLLIF